MRKSTSAGKTKKQNKHKKRLRIIFEIALMTLGVLCSIMPYPFPLLVPIGLGTIRIITQAVRKDNVEQNTAPVVYCNGAQDPKQTTAKTALKPKAKSAQKKNAQRKQEK